MRVCGGGGKGDGGVGEGRREGRGATSRLERFVCHAAIPLLGVRGANGVRMSEWACAKELS